MIVKLEPLNHEQRITRFVIALILLFSLLFFSFFNPVSYPITSCGFKNLFGIPCPSCGLSRSVFSLSHLHFQEAFGFNVMGPVLFFIAVVTFILLIAESISGEKVKLQNHKKIRKIFILIILVLWIGSWLLLLSI